MDKEFTKISVHNHFGGVHADYVFGEALGTAHSFSLPSAKAKLDSAYQSGFKLLGITNHNHFWHSEFSDLQAYIASKSYDICLLPGVEFDLMESSTSTKRLHVVMIISESSNLTDFDKDIVDFVTTNGGNYITIMQLVDLCFKYKCLIIPHGDKQKDRGAAKNPLLFDNIVSIQSLIPILIDENKKSKHEVLVNYFKSILSEENYNWLSNTGAIISADQTDFSNVIDPTYIWGPPSFDSLFYCAVIGDKRFFQENDIVEKSQYISKMIIKNHGGSLQNASITFSHGLNSIIGNSGSGKTMLLNLINKILTGQSLLNSVSSSNGDYDELYVDADVTLLDCNGREINQGSITVFEGDNLYKQVVKTLKLSNSDLLKELKAFPNFDKVNGAIDAFNTKLNKYISDQEEIIENNENISKSLKRFNSAVDSLLSNKGTSNSIDFIVDPKLYLKIDNLEEAIADFSTELNETNQKFDDIKALLIKYSLVKETNSLDIIKKKLIKTITIDSLKKKKELNGAKATLFISNKIQSLVNDYNNKIGQRAMIVSSSKQSMADETQNILQGLRMNAVLKESLVVPSISEEEIIRLCPQEVMVNTVKLDNYSISTKIDYDSLPTCFESSIGSSSWKLNKVLFKGIGLDISSNASVQSFADVFVQNKYKGKVELKLIDGDYLKYDVLIKTSDNSFKRIDSLSAGELSKIYINHLIDDRLKDIGNSAIILYDQPDNNLEKEFILSTLGEKINELKKKYQVIITTHEPLLVINADSNSIIKVTNDPIKGKSIFNFENISLCDSANREDAINKISRIIDGSKTAIKLRNKVYGGFDVW